MSFDQKKFLISLPRVLSEILKEFQNLGYVVTLVGGIPRDYLLTGKMGNDWDLEASHPTLTFNKDSWKDLGKTLKSFGKVTFLPYEIIRLEVGENEFEFSPQRKEEFLESVSGHSNFNAHYDLRMPFEEALLRRDFTINAIGIRLQSDQAQLLDPYQGVLHLHDKELYPVGSNFTKDPVRFLRAIRFSVKIGFELSSELTQLLKTMSLVGLTPSYVWSEAQKSKKPIEFFKRLLQEQHSELNLPLSAEQLEHKWEELSRVLRDPSLHESWIIALEWIGLSASQWQNYFSLSSETTQKLARWARHSKSFIHIKPELFHGEFEMVREKSEFEALFDWYFSTKQLLQKNASLPLLAMIEEYLPEWIHLYRFEAIKDVKHIDPPFRAKYQVWNLCQRL